MDKETSPYSNQPKKRSSVDSTVLANIYGKQRYHSRFVGKRNKIATLHIPILLNGRRILETQIQKFVA